MPNDQQPEDAVLFPPLPEEFASALEGMPEAIRRGDVYPTFLESQCGATDDSQPVEQYDGTLGVTRAFVDAHQGPVGQLQWNDNLGALYDNPGNVAGVRWCTGTLISDNLFLTAGHCFDRTGGGWQRPRVNGSNDIISSAEIARRMHVNFNYQVDPNGDLRTASIFAIEELTEYRLGGLDFAIVRLEGAPGRIFGTGKVAQQDAAVDDMICVIGHPAGVPKRIEAGPLTSFDDFRIRYNDIDTLGGNSGSAIWRSLTGDIVGVHTNGGCRTDGSGSNFGVRIGRLLEASPTLQNIAQPALEGLFTLQQKANHRFLDAYQSSNRDFSVVTRTSQNNHTQRWVITPVGGVYTVQQVINGRFVDAYESQSNNYSVTTRRAQNNDTQRWVLRPVADRLSTYTIQQLSTSRFLDAYTSGNDFLAVTRTEQNNDTQRWVLHPLGGNTYTLQQEVNGRFLDAYTSGNDFLAVTRTEQNNDTQRWVLTPVGQVCTIQQRSNGRHLDAYTSDNDHSAVTRIVQNNDTQRWILMPLGNETYTVQQLTTGRFMDAYTSSNNHQVATRRAQNNDTQRWIIKPA
ncbi:MAG: RICIN domain-containing protein [Acidobacteriota bacterium]